MTDTSNIPVCDVCGAPATQMERDLAMVESEKPWVEYEPHGPKRYGCDKHTPARSRIFRPNGTIDHRHEALERLCYLALGLQPPPLEQRE